MTRIIALSTGLLLAMAARMALAGFEVYPGEHWNNGQFAMTQAGVTLRGPLRCDDIRSHTGMQELDDWVLKAVCYTRPPPGKLLAAAGFRWGTGDEFMTSHELSVGNTVVVDGPLGSVSSARLPGAWALNGSPVGAPIVNARPGCPGPWHGTICGPRAGILAVSDGDSYYYARAQAVVHAIPTTPTAGCRITVPDLAIRAAPGTPAHGATTGALTCSTARRVRLYASGGAGSNVIRFGAGGLLARLTIDEVDSMTTPVYVDVKEGAMQNVTVGVDVDVGAATPGGDYIGTAILMIEEL